MIKLNYIVKLIVVSRLSSSLSIPFHGIIVTSLYILYIESQMAERSWCFFKDSRSSIKQCLFGFPIFLLSNYS